MQAWAPPALPLTSHPCSRPLPPSTPKQLVIVNLQRTQHDNKAAKSGGLVLHTRCDEVMAALARRLGLAVPPYVRRDAVMVGHQQHAAPGSVSSRLGALELAHRGSGSTEAAAASVKDEEAAAGVKEEEGGSSSGGDDGGSGREGGGIPFSLFVRSSHGPKCVMPMVQAVTFEFEVRRWCGM